MAETVCWAESPFACQSLWLACGHTEAVAEIAPAHATADNPFSSANHRRPLIWGRRSGPFRRSVLASLVRFPLLRPALELSHQLQLSDRREMTMVGPVVAALPIRFSCRRANLILVLRVDVIDVGGLQPCQAGPLDQNLFELRRRGTRKLGSHRRE